jgi:hypothetical protein
MGLGAWLRRHLDVGMRIDMRRGCAKRRGCQDPNEGEIIILFLSKFRCVVNLFLIQGGHIRRPEYGVLDMGWRRFGTYSNYFVQSRRCPSDVCKVHETASPRRTPSVTSPSFYRRQAILYRNRSRFELVFRPSHFLL